MLKWVLFAVLLCLSCAKAPTPKTESIGKTGTVSPQLFFQTAFIFDSECEKRTGFKVDSSMQEELHKKIGVFRESWDRLAPQLVKASENAAGRVFQRKEYSVALALCRWTPMGDPAFIVSVRPYLGPSRVDRGTQLPMGMEAFVAIMHHELLHSLLDNIVNPEFFNSSVLLKKYSNETFNVQVHLHLMALQKAVNDQVGDAGLVQATSELYRYIGGDYQRAWDIVAVEGVGDFLGELLEFNKGRGG